MANIKFRKYFFQKGNTSYIIEEDLVGWYLLVYDKEKAERPLKDYLLDSLEEAFFEAQDRFDIPRDSWKEIYD